MKKILPLLLVICLISCHRNEGNVETKIYKQTETVYANSDKVDKLDMSFSIEYVTAMPEEKVLSAVQDTLMSYLFDDPFDSLDIEDAIDQYIDVMAEEYKIVNSEYSGHFTDEVEESATFSAEMNLTGEVVSIENNVMTYLVTRYIYYGGAHGNTTLTYLNFNESTGALITESDLFVEGYQPKLAQMLVAGLMRDLEVTSVDALEEYAFDVESIEPNGNFYFDENGMWYVFNTYEIAPYAMGAISIFIDNETLKPILK